jgi:phosphopantothenoylcysteine decarboxylase/phosphopantothenate--cysteine ligase
MKILITAGPTWVKIDEVRILTSIFTGRTGIYLAKEFKKKGHSVTLFLNPHLIGKIKGVQVIPFKYFEDFKEKITKELKRNDYDVIIHSAAVSDYKLKKTFEGKIPSGKKELTLKLIPTEKVIKIMRKLAKDAVIIQFKLEIKRKDLLGKAYRSLKENKTDFVVANALEDLRLGYKAFIMDKENHTVVLNSQKSLFNNLHKIISKFGRK